MYANIITTHTTIFKYTEVTFTLGSKGEGLQQKMRDTIQMRKQIAS